MTTTTPRPDKAVKVTSRTPRPGAARQQQSGVAKKSYSIPLAAAAHAEKLAKTQGISTSALVGRAIEEMYERSRQIAQAREIAEELLAEAIEAYGPVTNDEEADIAAFLAEVKAAGA